MRLPLLLLCLALAGCSSARTYADGDAAEAESPSAAVIPAPGATPAPPPARTASGGNRLARGGHVPPPSSVAEAPAVPEAQRLQEARGLCWMKVEEQKIRDIDRRSAFVDKCVVEAMKSFR